jgi:hypothetical protein
MKLNIIISFALLLVSSVIRAQSNQDLATDIKSYEQEIERIREISPGRHKIIIEYSKTEILLTKTDPTKSPTEQIDKVPLRKKGEYISIQDFLELNEHQKINPFVLGFFPGTNMKTYKLGESGYTLVIPSQKQLLKN